MSSKHPFFDLRTGRPLFDGDPNRTDRGRELPTDAEIEARAIASMEGREATRDEIVSNTLNHMARAWQRAAPLDVPAAASARAGQDYYEHSNTKDKSMSTQPTYGLTPQEDAARRAALKNITSGASSQSDVDLYGYLSDKSRKADERDRRSSFAGHRAVDATYERAREDVARTSGLTTQNFSAEPLALRMSDAMLRFAERHAPPTPAPEPEPEREREPEGPRADFTTDRTKDMVRDCLIGDLYDPLARAKAHEEISTFASAETYDQNMGTLTETMRSLQAMTPAEIRRMRRKMSPLSNQSTRDLEDEEVDRELTRTAQIYGG